MVVDLGWWSMAVWRHLDALLPGGALVALITLSLGLAAGRVALHRVVERVGGAIDEDLDIEEQAGVFLTTLVASGGVMAASAFYAAFLVGLALSSPVERDLEPLLDAPFHRGVEVVVPWALGLATWAGLRALRGWRRSAGRARLLQVLLAGLEVPMGLLLPMAFTTVRVVAFAVGWLGDPRSERPELS